MKKRLLITSIVMMLVVAVALSTATYAWFTQNASVKASSVSLTAATNNAPSIGISWTNSGFGTEITATGPSGVFAPMVPVAAAAFGTANTTISAATAAGGVDFYSATIKDSPARFNADVKHWGAAQAADQVAPYVWSDNNSHTSFFLKNLSDTFGLGTVTLTATVDGKGADLIRIAVFARTIVEQNQPDFTLRKILSNASFTYTAANEYTANTVYYADQNGTIAMVGTGSEAHVIANTADFTTYTTNDTERTDDDKVVYTRVASAAATGTAYALSAAPVAANALVDGESGVIKSNATDNAISVDLGALAANGVIEVIVYVWTDGTALVDNRGGEVASIKLDVEATRAQ